ncbi:MAG: chlorite dismutase family protein [Myxococcota bacterium]
MLPVAPPRIWTRFLPTAALPSALPTDARVTNYRIDAIEPIHGNLALPFAAGAELTRVESETTLLAHEAGLTGVTGHVVYTDRAPRAELAQISAKESGPCAVLIPIRKSPAWWALAQDERTNTFRGAHKSPGHHAIGTDYAARIFRRLYHARSLPGSNWDFLTYFEFPESQRPTFVELLRRLRDPRENPEWEFVDAEVECWMKKL